MDEKSAFAVVDSSRLYRLDNNSTTWQLSNSGLPSDAHLDVKGMSGKGDTLFVCLQYAYNNSPSNGVYRSTDHGASWLKLINALATESYGWVFINGNILFASGQKFYRSTDWGNSWTDISTKVGNKNIFRMASINDTIIYTHFECNS